MNQSIITGQVTETTTLCPYCNQKTPVQLPTDYAPVYAFCQVCGEKFILERLAEGFQVLTLQEAPCCSDPDCREIEMGHGSEG